MAGICDEPRIESQIIETAKQFWTVKTVKVFINGKPMKKCVSPVYLARLRVGRGQYHQRSF